MYFNNQRNYSLDNEVSGERKMTIIQELQKHLKWSLTLGKFSRNSESFF